MKKIICCLFVILTAAFLFCSCSNDTVNVKIIDERFETQIAVKRGTTVQEALSLAEIALSDKDKVKPSFETILDADTEIKIGRYAVVKLINGDKVKKYKLTGKKVSDLLKLNGTENSDNVKLNYDKSVFLSEIKGDIILQKKKTVSFILAGERAEIETYCETVIEFLKEQNIEIGKSDNLSVEPDAKLVDGMEITLQKVETKTETVTETIPYKTQKENSSSLQSGKTQIKKQGVNGEKLCTYKVTYVDGKAQSRELISSEIIKAPIDQVVLYGTKKVVSSEKPGKTIVSKEDQPDCDGSGHGYYIITYSDGSVEYVDY